MIAYKAVCKSFDGGRYYAVNNVSFAVQAGETLVLLGSSGSGKTTLLKLTNRLLEPDEGIIELDGQDISRQDPISLRRRIGYVFQGIGLFPHMTIEANVAMVPRLLGWSRSTQREKTNQLLRMVGLSPDSYVTRRNSRAVNSKGLPLRERWQPTPNTCSWTSPSEPWTLSRVICSSRSSFR